MVELAAGLPLFQSLYFPFEAVLEGDRDRSASDVAELVRILQSEFRDLLEEVLGPDLATYFGEMGLLDQVVLVAEIHCSEITIKGMILTGLGFFAGSLMEPAIQQSEAGRAAIQAITRAIDAVSEAGVDTARQGAEHLVEAWKNAANRFPTGRFRITSIEVSDGGLRITLVDNGGGADF